VHTGRFEVDGKSFEAFLGYEYEITATFGESSSILCLVAQDGRRASYTNTEQFNVMPWLAGKYYRFSCTPTGDKLFAHAYDGPLGVLELGAGGRDTQKLQMMGQLCSQGSIVGIGYPLDEKGRPQGTARCEIPAGDYYPRYMNASLGKIGFTFSDNYYSDGPSRTRRAERPVHSIKIRRDKPYVLDFSNKPVVTFLRPARNEPLFLGQEMRVEAVLVDPVLNIMIRGLNDLTRTEKRTYKTPDGQEHSSDWSPSLDPKVTIARADGQIIAEGTMPFG
jgi:hypothetical protein